MRKRKWQTLANEKSLTWTRLTPPPWIVLSIQWCRNYPLSALLTEVPVPSEADHRAVVALDGASVKDATDTVCMTLAHQSINLTSFEVLDGDPRFICKRDRSMIIFKKPMNAKHLSHLVMSVPQCESNHLADPNRTTMNQSSSKHDRG